MATVEVASVSMGPQYAPEDSTLVKPWKGLIDGSTGVLYYWNPENNVTQYERPANLEPPVAPTQPAFAPKLAPIPTARSFQPIGVSGQHGQQISQPMQQEVQQMTQGVQPWGQYTPHQQIGGGSQHYTAHMPQGSQTGQELQQTEQIISQHPRSQSFQQPREQVPQHLGQPPFQHEGQHMPHPQGQHFPPQQVQQMPYQNPSSMNGQQDLHPQGRQFVTQEGHKLGYSHSGSYEFQPGKESRFSSSQQHGGQNLPPTGSLIQQHGTDPIDRQQMGGPTGQNHSGQHAAPSVRPNMAPGEDSGLRAGNGFNFNPNKEGPPMVPQPSNLTPVPMPQIQQEMRFPLSGTSSHGGVHNSVLGHSSAQVYNNAVSSRAFSNFTSAVPPPGIQDSSAVRNISACEAYRREHEISATGDNVPDPIMTFEATGFPPEILREMHSAGFSSPTPIQAQTWPIAMQSTDIVAIAKTGSGKTLGYIIPAFMHLRQSRNVSQNGPTVLVLAPTRELATQIQEEVIKFGRSSRISCTCLYGGAPKGPQLKELERGADIVVATPGRLNDILEMKKIDFRQVSFLVLDEADRMLDMGFEPQIRTIVNKIPPRRQTLMYTATWPKEVRKIAGDLLVNPVQVNIGSVELSANKSITQYVEVVPQMNKQRRLEQILRAQERGSRAIIFCSTKRLCDQLTRSIGRNFGAAAIHGDKSQGERDWVLNQFRSGKSPVLVATDVAARGLDVKDIRVVVNYDFPTGIEDYVHRIGRTGRAGAAGVAYTFFSDQDRKHAADLVKVLEGANQRVPPELQEMAGRGGPSFSKFRGGMSRWDSGGEQTVPAGRGGRGSGFDDRGAMRDGGFGGRGGMRDGGFGGGMRDGGFGGRGGMRDGGFGGRGGRNNFGGRGNQAQRFSGGRHDNSPSGRYDNRSGQHSNGRDGRSSNRSRDRSPDMVRTWDTRSRSSSRSSSRSRSRSWSRSRSPIRFSSKRLLEQKLDREPRVSSISPGTHGTSSSAAPTDMQPVTSDT